MWSASHHKHDNKESHMATGIEINISELFRDLQTGDTGSDQLTPPEV